MKRKDLKSGMIIELRKDGVSDLGLVVQSDLGLVAQGNDGKYKYIETSEAAKIML